MIWNIHNRLQAKCKQAGIWFWLLCLLLTACQTESALPTPLSTADPLVPTPSAAVQSESEIPAPDQIPATPTTLAAGMPTAVPILIDMPGVFPAMMSDAVERIADESNGRFVLTEAGDAQLHLAVNEGTVLARWLYVIAAPFATYSEATTLAEVQAAWQGSPSAMGTFVVGEDVVAAFSPIWGEPAASMIIVPVVELKEALWAARPSWTMMPFETLTPDLKLIPLDGRSPLTHDFDQVSYPLYVPFGVVGDSTAIAAFRAAWDGPTFNRDPNLLSRISMTGVTALGRATAYQMELKGVTAPGLVVGPVLETADITHISHEVAFAPDCPYPNPVGDPVFCADDRYLELLQFVGTDVVELTGNHVNDWGADNLLHTIDLYDAAGMATFGGGRDLVDAWEPALFEHNGNKIAFVGCNPVGPSGAWATEERAGSLPCDYPALYEQIGQLREEGYFVIATQQYQEYYQYPATPQQITDFHLLADAGANAVSGSQGHHVQGFDFYDGAFIHYGLGNLFFDQYQSIGLLQSFIDTYVIYNGRLISVELFTSMIEEFCCPRLMTPEERQQALQSAFQASGW